MTSNMELEVQQAKLEAHHLVEHVNLIRENGNAKLEVIPTDAHAKWQLENKDWSEYTVYVEIQ